MMLTQSQQELLAEVCWGDLAALEFARAFVLWVHWIDDVVDQDALWTPRETIRVNLEAARAFSLNPFFQRHKLQLAPLIIQAFRAFADSVAWAARAEVKDRRAVDVFKSFYHEVIWHIAYIVGGWEHMSAMTAKWRRFDYDCKE